MSWSGWRARDFGEVFDRPFPGALPRWDDGTAEPVSPPRDAEFWDTRRAKIQQAADAVKTRQSFNPGHRIRRRD